MLKEGIVGFRIAQSRFVGIGRAQADFDVAGAYGDRRAPATNGQDDMSLDLVDDVGWNADFEESVGAGSPLDRSGHS